MNNDLRSVAATRKEAQNLQSSPDAVPYSRKWRYADNACKLYGRARRLAGALIRTARAISPLSRTSWSVWRNSKILENSGLFDQAWYAKQYKDVAEAGVSPLHHYLTHGVAECRNPNPVFQTNWYLAQNPDVAQKGANPPDEERAIVGRISVSVIRRAALGNPRPVLR